ncbi:MAG: 2-oxoacid:acceptor oxidoreductase subunit alpha [Deltaproteobacteria bacterium]|nr:2-oxoacid:acceptor oxidoreductase subunit alpha [Deltaproteobacteria bacterium]
MKDTKQLESVSVRFAGDSGDGMQLVGDRFATLSAGVGNDVITFPDYPAEIRPPVGSVGGVSGYQLNLGSHVYTSGDYADVLVAMNPAAVKANLGILRKGSTILANLDAFNDKNLEKAGFTSNPLQNGELKDYNVIGVPMVAEVRNALKGTSLGAKEIERCKNFFALGLTSWLLSHPVEPTLRWLEKKFQGKPDIIDANKKAVQSGFEFGERSELLTTRYAISKPAIRKKAGCYRYVIGNSAVAFGLMTAADRAGLRLFLGSYPITPASEILQELSGYKNFPITVLQAEDEIAAIGAAIGASFAGALAATSTSGPGLALKGEFINLAVIAELPLVIIDVQRAGPSTGLPTKSEQSDLFQALWGRNGESPLPVLAANTPADCYAATIEACKVALKYMTPVMLLTDGYLAQGAQAMRIPEPDEIPKIEVAARPSSPKDWLPYQRNKQTLARSWAAAGTPGFMHRVGGLEKEENSGKYTTDPVNHQRMVELRAEKIMRVAQEIPPSEIFGDPKGKLLVLGWGSTFGAIRGAVRRLHAQGLPVAHLDLRWIHPFPPDLGAILKRFDNVLVPENNLGQLNTKLRSEYLIKTETFHKVQGRPFTSVEIEERIRKILGA